MCNKTGLWKRIGNPITFLTPFLRPGCRPQHLHWHTFQSLTPLCHVKAWIHPLPHIHNRAPRIPLLQKQPQRIRIRHSNPLGTAQTHHLSIHKRNPQHHFPHHRHLQHPKGKSPIRRRIDKRHAPHQLSSLRNKISTQPQRGIVQN